MARARPEWIGKTDDSRPPPRVLLRVLRAHNGICYLSGRKIKAGEPWQADHVIALINGGRNIESNLRPALVAAHKTKTASDVAEKAKVDAIAKRHTGITKPKGNIKSAPFAQSDKPKREPRQRLPPRRLYVAIQPEGDRR